MLYLISLAIIVISKITNPKVISFNKWYSKELQQIIEGSVPFQYDNVSAHKVRLTQK